MRARYFLLAILQLAATDAIASEAFRCGQWIITDELSVSELRAKCGEPKSQTTEIVDVRGKAGSGSVSRGTSTIEHWTYEFASGGSRYVVTIVDGDINSIERAPK